MEPQIDLNIANETDTLKSVIVGISTCIGQPANNNPKAKFHLENGTFPTEEQLINDTTQFVAVLKANGVHVYRPENIVDLCQIFPRDIGFVIGDRFFIANMVEARKDEINRIDFLLDKIPQGKIIDIRREAANAKVEGGDVLIWDDYILVGKSLRTNDAGFSFLREAFPGKKVVQIPVTVSANHLDNVLHLDCALQPVGHDSVILYREGIKDKETLDRVMEILEDKKIPQGNIIDVNKDEAYRMFPNIFSISKNKVIIEKSFTRLKAELAKRGIEAIEIDYAETSKLSGLLRCSTLPLERV